MAKRKNKGVSKRLKALDGLLTEERPKSELEKLCIHRQINDLENGHERGLYWDEDEVQRNLAFVKILKHWQGPATGKLFEPEPWQEELILAPIFGWTYNKSRADGGKRRFRKGGVEIPRKNGKSFVASAIANQGLICDGESGASVYSAATKADQARIIFDCSKKMLPSGVFESIGLEKRKDAILIESNGSIYRPLASDHKSLDGLNTSRALIDELHAHRTREVFDVILTSMGARSEPLLIWVTTAGYNKQSIWYEQRQYCENVVKGNHDDDAYFFYISTIDEQDDWSDPEVWWKANPNLNISVSEEYLADEYHQAAQSPEYENTFRQLHLNQITQQAVRFIPMDAWRKCSQGMSREEYLRTLVGRKCWAGLDLASTRDLCAWVVAFPFEDGTIRFKASYFAPKDASSQRQQYDKQSYQGWANQGLVTLTPGTVTDYSYIKEQMIKDRDLYDLQDIAFDPFSMNAFYQELVREGWHPEQFVQFNQTRNNYNEPLGRLLEIIKDQTLDHGDDPVMEWMAQNMTVATDARGYIQPDKENSQDKIDGLSAFTMAYGILLKEDIVFPATGEFYIHNSLEMM